MKIKRLCAVVFAAMLVLSAQMVAAAQETPPTIEELLTAASEEVRVVEQALDQNRIGANAIEDARANLEVRRKQLAERSAEIAASLDPLRKELEALGPAPDDGAEAADISAIRAELEGRIAELDGIKKRLQASVAQIEAVSDRLVDFRRERFTRTLLERQASPASPDRIAAAWESVKVRTAAIEREVRARVNNDGASALLNRLALPVLLAILAFALGWVVKRLLVRWIRGQADHEVPRAGRARLTAAITLVRLVLPSIGVAMIVIGLRESGILGPNGIVLLRALSFATTAIILAYAFGAAYFAPQSWGLRISGMDDDQARIAYRWYMTLAAVVAVDQLLVASGHDLRLTTDALSVINAILLIIGGIALWRFVRAAGVGAGKTQREDGLRSIRIVGRVARAFAHFIAIAAPVLALLGYYGASRFLFFPMVYSGAVIGVAILIYAWIVAVSTPEEPEKAEDSEEAEEADAVERPSPVLPVVAGFTLTLLAIPILAIVWGAKATDLQSAWSVISDGFTVGDIAISPMDFLVFGVVFAFGYFLTRMIQGVLRRSVFPVLKIDEGAKAALLAGIGYVGIVIAALIAISTTGLDLSNLAIVAGALSVGIGFGLQNVVNNFVSGIILLIERPIKVGDWVEIGGNHGVVRRINVRSTQIQKFDRSTMFVPNADLISGVVTNWYHGDGQGQLILPIGVAYGSDVRQVEKILLEVAAQHPMVVRDPAPFVVFKDFGASSLDFELRGIMADVNMIVRLPSELRFSIYQRFTEEGIEIPFAQRDITIRNISDLRLPSQGEADASS